MGGRRTKGETFGEKDGARKTSCERETRKKGAMKSFLSHSLSRDDELWAKRRRCGFYAGRERTGRERRGRNRGGRIRRGARFSTKPIIRCVTSRGRDDGVPGVVALYRRKRVSRVSFSTPLASLTATHEFTALRTGWRSGLLLLIHRVTERTGSRLVSRPEPNKCANHNVITIANYCA